MDFLINHGITAVIVLYGVGALGALIAKRQDVLAHWWGSGVALAASLLGVATGVSLFLATLAGGVSVVIPTPIMVLALHFDGLSSLFTVLISGIAAVCSLYSIGYAKHWYGRYPVGVLGFFYNLFLASMTLVALANHAVLFLIVWEIMSISSYFMIVFEHKNEDNIKAGFLYLVMTHLGTAAIIIAFLLMYGEVGSLSFDDWRTYGAALPEASKLLIGGLALVGFGTKAGIIPLHTWLPQAHPAAPSHVSALMSGVMIKMGIYMIIRVLFDFIPGMPAWAGMVVLMLGVISSLLGVLYALAEHDLKRLLAYHSIENIGIILLGIGAAMIFGAMDMSVLMTLGLVAALYHTVNHAVFKALLFLGAGAVVSATHTRNIEEYGGLIKAMPITSLVFLIGAIAISGLPPFNGFMSEWLTFQAMIQGVRMPDILTTAIFVGGIGALAFTGGLAAACFVKAFGATFLARARSEEASHAREASISMQIAMGVLAGLCLLLGIGAGVVTPVLEQVASGVTNYTTHAVMIEQGGVVTVAGGFSFISMLQIFGMLALLGGVIWLGVKITTRGRTLTISETWDCGRGTNARMEITATAFSRSLIMIFKNYLQPVKAVHLTPREGMPEYFGSLTVHTELKNVYNTYLYHPAVKVIGYCAQYLRRTQGGNLNLYLAYIMVTVIGLLIWVAH